MTEHAAIEQLKKFISPIHPLSEESGMISHRSGNLFLPNEKQYSLPLAKQKNISILLPKVFNALFTWGMTAKKPRSFLRMHILFRCGRFFFVATTFKIFSRNIDQK
jgi:hypothetical protein